MGTDAIAHRRLALRHKKGGQLNYKKYVEDMSVIARDQLEEQRKTNAALLRIEGLLTEQVRRDD
jgi:predicted component of type VI protein secretion system